VLLPSMCDWGRSDLLPVSEKSVKAFERSCRKALFELVWPG
jgi:hypothetical protein